MTSNRSDGSLETLIEQAARQIADADFLLIATGAGFSADSGLPTYTDVARNPIYESLGIEYGDLCRIQCLKENPRLFYGFWGTCFNLYQRQVQPHPGYSILSRWCREKQSNLNKKFRTTNDGDDNKNKLSAYYLYTSNVDGHFRLAGFPEENLHEVHGAIDRWLVVLQAKDQTQDGKTTQLTTSKVEWISVPDSYSFPVDPSTLEGPPPKSILSDLIDHEDELSLQLRQSSFLRPGVLMFDDGFDSHEQMHLDTSCDKYQAWERNMELAMEVSKNLKLVVLEIGCGTRVPSVRIECQDVISDTQRRINSKLGEKEDKGTVPRCSFIRINPDHENIQVGIDVPENVIAISIRGTALDTLQRIDEHYTRNANETKS